MDRSPGAQCTICNHPLRVEIDKALRSHEGEVVTYSDGEYQPGVTPTIWSIKEWGLRV